MIKALPLSWLAVAIPIAALFGPALVADRSFAFRDAGHFYYPLFEWCCGEWAAGRAPLWNPYENCGVPVLGDTTSSIFYPGKLLFLLPLGFAFRYKLYIVGHVVLAALGSYRLSRAWKVSAPGAAVAAIAYSCGGNVVFQYTNVVFLVGAAWLPFAALAADRMLRERSWLAALGLSVVVALMILGGDPEAAYHGLLITSVYAVILAWFPPDELPIENSSRWRRATLLLNRLGLTGLAGGLAFLLAAVQILPSAEAIRFSDRTAFNRPRNIYEAAMVALQASEHQPLGETKQQCISRGLLGEPQERTHHELAYEFSIGPWRLVEYFWPNFGGRMLPTHRRWFSLLPAEGRVWTPTLYMGLLPMVFAVGALRLRAGRPREVWLSLIALIFTLGTFGFYGVGWLLREILPRLQGQNPDGFSVGSPVGGVYWLMLTLLPEYAYFRYPAKLLPLIALAVSQLAARGFDRAIVEPTSRLRSALLVLGAGSGISALVLACVGSRFGIEFAQRLFAWCVGPATFAKIEWNDALFGPFDAAGAYRDVLLALSQTAAVAIAGWWLLGNFASAPARLERRAILLVLLTAVEVAVANGWLVSTAPIEAWSSEPAFAALMKSHAAPDTFEAGPRPRVFRAKLATWRPPSFSTTAAATRPADIVQWEHETLFPKHHLASGLALVESYGSIKSADYDSLLSVAKEHGPPQSDKSLLPQPTALRLLGTEFLVLPRSHRPEFADRIADSALPASDRESTAGTMPEDAALWRMNRTLPRAWIVHDVQVMPELSEPRRKASIDQRSYDVLFPDGRPRDFLKSATIETSQPPSELSAEAANLVRTDSHAVTERCEIRHYSPQRVVIEARLDRAGLVILSDAWNSGWKAFVISAQSQKEVLVYRTNRVLRGVWLPPGKHTLEYRYQPQSFSTGAVISGLSWMVVMIAAVAALRSNRQLWRAS